MSDRRMADRSRAPALEIRALNVYYGASHALQGVDLSLKGGVLSVVGRNGMGKTTLCKAIMGLVPVASGSISFAGQSLVGLAPADIAQLGVGYVPQGRRLWPSLTVDEHLRLVVGERKGAWTIDRVYATFPRLAERKSNGGGQLSGGEQQMLAISRALLLNPRLLVMDEPTEGLAPVIVAQVEEMLQQLGEEGDMDVLVIEQNIGVAMHDRRKRRDHGQRPHQPHLIAARELAGDRELQQRLLGVGRHGHEDIGESGTGSRRARRPQAAALPAHGPIAHLYVQPEAADAVVAAGSGRTDRGAGAHQLRGFRPCFRRGCRARPARCRPQAAIPTSSLPARSTPRATSCASCATSSRQQGLRVRLVDLSTSGKPSGADVPPIEVALNHPRGSAGVFTGDRGTSVAAMAQAFEAWIRRQPGVAGIISAGGSGGSSLVAPAMRALPIGVPKVLISTVASGNVQGYVGPSDIMMMHSVTDVQGLNSISRQVLANGAQAMAGMVKQRLAEAREAVQTPGGGRAARGRPHHVRRHDAMRAAGHGAAQGRIRLPRVPRHRHRRAVDGEAGRVAPAHRRHRRLDHGNLRHDDGRRVPRDGRPLRRHHPHAHALYRLGRRTRHGQLRRARDGARALQVAHVLPAQPAGDADAHHGGGERAHGPLDRRAAQPHGGARALPAARGRRLGARCARPALP